MAPIIVGAVSISSPFFAVTATIASNLPSIDPLEDRSHCTCSADRNSPVTGAYGVLPEPVDQGKALLLR